MKKLFVVASLCLTSWGAHAQTDWLISPAEALAYQGEGGFLQGRIIEQSERLERRE